MSSARQGRPRARTTECKLCNARVKASVAAHDCPHGNPCRYLCKSDGLPLDWKTPECERCQRGESIGQLLPFRREPAVVDED